MKKSFVLDTNVLLHNAAALEAFADNEVVIPIDVVEELDQFKTLSNELGRNARWVVRELDRLRTDGNLREGVPIKNTGGTVRVVLQPGSLEGTGLSPEITDNRIISVALELHRKGVHVVFVSKDMNARIKSDSLGIRTEDFEQQKVDIDTLYSGWKEVRCSGDVINDLYGHKSIPRNGIDLLPNQFTVLRDDSNPKHTAMARCTSDGKLIMLLRNGDLRPMGVAARNMEQRMAIDILCDPDIDLVTLVGRAGTGKTLLALACGLAQIMGDPRYEKVLVSRPIMPLGRDIGYLPGTKEEKLGHWMMPIYDNLGYLLTLKGARGEVGKKVDDFLRSGMIEIEALTYIRGRSIPRQFMIVDEAQNLTPHEVKTIISRAGEGTKIVLTGDPYQIDNPYLDASSNGLTYTAERLKGQPLVGHIMLTRSERSDIASLAADAL
jgi:PhoH-like ATPase